MSKMTGTTHLTGVPDLKTSLISKPVTVEIREIRVSTVAWEVQPRLKFLSQIQPRLKFLSQIQPRLNFVAIFSVVSCLISINSCSFEQYCTRLYAN